MNERLVVSVQCNVIMAFSNEIRIEGDRWDGMTGEGSIDPTGLVKQI